MSAGSDMMDLGKRWIMECLIIGSLVIMMDQINDW